MRAMPPPRRASWTARARVRLRGRGGFTLIEMMVVVSIIALMAALATPSILEILRDRRVQRHVTNFMLVLQDAKARSFGRGAAVRVDYCRAAGTGCPAPNLNGVLLKQEEALDDVDGNGSGDFPSPSCLACFPGDAACAARTDARWTRTSNYFQIEERNPNLLVTIHDGNSATPLAGNHAFCFSPQGRVYNVSGAVTPMTSLHVFRFTPSLDGSTLEPGRTQRKLYFTSSGLVRLAL
jgi:type IV fimbrial biogenesis protein FimT